MSEGVRVPTLLVIDDDPLMRRSVQRTLSSQGYRVLVAASGREGLETLSAERIDVALVDLEMPEMDGLEVLRMARKTSPATECIILTQEGDIATAYSSLDAGASDYFEKPIQDWQRFQQVLRRATEVRRLKDEKELLHTQAERRGTRLIGNSPELDRVRHLVHSVAKSTASILILGESGVGKELVAEAIHEESCRHGQFVRINCASVPGELIEGELFGWEKGAHSMATSSKQGLFEVAEAGTMLLDEIGDMPLDLQAKLLRVLESRRFRRLGGTKELSTDVRILAATNFDLSKRISAGLFRADLYYRLNVLTIPVPTLRERRDDVALLTYHFIKMFNASEARGVRRVDKHVLQRLEAYDWPGNVRELRNVLHRAVLLSTDEALDPNAVEDAIGPVGDTLESVVDFPMSSGVAEPLPDLLALHYAEAKQTLVRAFTVRYLSDRLAHAGGNITRAADASGMLRPNFRRLMKQFDVEVPTAQVKHIRSSD